MSVRIDGAVARRGRVISGRRHAIATSQAIHLPGDASDGIAVSACCKGLRGASRHNRAAGRNLKGLRRRHVDHGAAAGALRGRDDGVRRRWNGRWGGIHTGTGIDGSSAHYGPSHSGGSCATHHIRGKGLHLTDRHAGIRRRYGYGDRTGGTATATATDYAKDSENCHGNWSKTLVIHS